MVKSTSRLETIAGIAAVALLTVGCFVVVRPFVSAILWAAVLAYTTWPLMDRLNSRMHGRRSLAAFIMTLLIALIMIVPFAVAGVTLAENVSRIESLFRLVQGGLPPAAPEWVGRIPLIGEAAARAWPRLAADTGFISNTLTSAGLAAGKWLLRHGFDLGKGVLQLTLSVVITFVFYRDGDRMMTHIRTGAQRIAGDRSLRVLSVAGGTVRGVVYGIIGAALAQAIAATIGFWVAAVPSPFLLGLVTFLFAFIPGGPPLIWVPVTIWLFHEGRLGWGIFMAVWGVFGISGVDNLIRPYLISRGASLPFIIVLLGVLGGMFAFGFIGVFLGPVLLSVAYVLVKEFTAGGAPAPAQSRPETDKAQAK